jgi:hypothetical protein
MLPMVLVILMFIILALLGIFIANLDKFVRKAT